MKFAILLLTVTVVLLPSGSVPTSGQPHARYPSMIEPSLTCRRIKDHLTALTVTIGERSLALPDNLERTAVYIENFHRKLGLSVTREPYTYYGRTVANIVTEVSFGPQPRNRYLVGAHYDSVAGTVGADDNASAIAVQLETARNLQALIGSEDIDLAVTFVSFALEEPPVYGTRYMGSRVYAKKARQRNKRIDGMICLEMVGYACYQSGCQAYPFPLNFFGYPKTGDFIGVVGNTKSKSLVQALVRAFRHNKALPVVKLTVPFDGFILPSIRLSDHASFWDQGFKAVMITDSAFYRNPHYHRSSDTMEKLDYPFMAELVESLVLFFRSFKKQGG